MEEGPQCRQYDDIGMRGRRFKSQNIVHDLKRREINHNIRGTYFNRTRCFYQQLVPNLSVLNVEKPPCYLRKFSPDGKFFIAISYDQTSLEIFDFLGSEAAGNLTNSVKGDVIPSEGGSMSVQYNQIRMKIFSQFLQKRHVVRVTIGDEVLNRECSLFTDDGRYVIVGSSHQLHEDVASRYYDIYRNNESITPNSKLLLEDYTVFVIDLKTGVVCDRKQFKMDKIYLSHNQGLCLYGSVLAILSVQQQTIHVFKISPQGTLIQVRTIGRFCYDDDEFFYNQTSQVLPRQLNRPFSDKTINSLKHRLIAYLYRASLNGHLEYGTRGLHWVMEDLLALRLSKLQLLDESHLLLKYAMEEVVTFRNGQPNNTPSLFVVYNMDTTEITGVYEHTSPQLLEIMENFHDHFRNSWRHLQPQFPSSPSSSIYARRIQQMFKTTLIVAKNGGQREAISRMLTQLPISAQSYSCSPYLDHALFSYDDKWISQLERPKTCSDHPIRFFTRESGMLRFCIDTGPVERQLAPPHRRLVAFLFHPSEPFMISVQRTAADYKVNFHIRKIPT